MSDFICKMIVKKDSHDILNFNDMLYSVCGNLSTVGFPKAETNPEYSGGEGTGTPNGYVVTADGEPLAMTQPQPFNIENHIQFHGGFLEDSNLHTDPGTDGVMGYPILREVHQARIGMDSGLEKVSVPNATSLSDLANFI